MLSHELLENGILKKIISWAFMKREFLLEILEEQISFKKKGIFFQTFLKEDFLNEMVSTVIYRKKGVLKAKLHGFL